MTQKSFSQTSQSSFPSKQFYTYTSDEILYALGWSYRKDNPFRLGVCTFCEDGDNTISILNLNNEDQDEEIEIPSNDKYDGNFREDLFSQPQRNKEDSSRTNDSRESLKVTHFVNNLQYPATKLMFMPDTSVSNMDLIISSGNGLRLWNIRNDGNLDLTSLLSTNEFSVNPPLTSFDWCVKDLHQVGTSSIDSLVIIWDIAVGKPKTKLIAHDKEVYDIAFQDSFVFGTVGADGSARVFDMRDLNTSTIVHETASPLLKLSWNQQSPNFFATFEMNSSKVTIVDIRNINSPYVVCELDNGHSASVNAIQWAPHSWCHLSSAGEDSQVLIWDLYKIPKPIEEPILSYSAPSIVQQLQWATLHPDWIAITSEKQLQLLRV